MFSKNPIRSLIHQMPWLWGVRHNWQFEMDSEVSVQTPLTYKVIRIYTADGLLQRLAPTDLMKESETRYFAHYQTSTSETVEAIDVKKKRANLFQAMRKSLVQPNDKKLRDGLKHIVAHHEDCLLIFDFTKCKFAIHNLYLQIAQARA